MKSRFFRNSTKERLYDFFYRDATVFHEVPLTPLVSRHAKSQKTLRPTRPLCVT